MPARYRDDSPSMFNLSRRKVLIGGTLLAGSLAAGPALPALLPESDTPFMKLSKLLIPHQLDPEIGKRIVAALTAIRPSLAQDVPALLAIASKKDARIVEDFFPDVPDGPLKETALSQNALVHARTACIKMYCYVSRFVFGRCPNAFYWMGEAVHSDHANGTDA
jgi:hypothetical protein